MLFCDTVLLGVEERGVHRRSLASFLVFSIPADFNPACMEAVQCVSSVLTFQYVLIFTFLAWHVLILLKIPAWLFFGKAFFGTQQHCVEVCQICVVFSCKVCTHDNLECCVSAAYLSFVHFFRQPFRLNHPVVSKQQEKDMRKIRDMEVRRTVDSY